MFIGGQEAEHMEMKGRDCFRDDFQGREASLFHDSYEQGLHGFCTGEGTVNKGFNHYSKYIIQGGIRI
jgi:hypothetical protein